MCHPPGYDGFVLEFFVERGLVELVRALRTALGPHRSLILAIPSYQMPLGGGSKAYVVQGGLLDSLEPFIDRFSLMTYDAPLSPTGVPNAPLGWVRDSITALLELTKKARRKRLKGKLLLGLPWYGKDNGKAVLGHEVVAILEKYPSTIHWVEDAAEHTFTFHDGGEMHHMTFPTPLFVTKRIELAEEMGLAGVAIWEIGQGLKCLADLL